MRSFTILADIAAHNALNHQQQNQSAVENRERQQIEDAEIETDAGGQIELRQPVTQLAFRSLSPRQPQSPLDQKAASLKPDG